MKSLGIEKIPTTGLGDYQTAGGPVEVSYMISYKPAYPTIL